MPIPLTPEDENPDDDQILRILNDAKRTDLEARYGARFQKIGTHPLPPEIESEWLDHIAEFHRQMESAEEVTVRQFVGFPEVRALADLPEPEVEAELERLLDLLNGHGIFATFPDYVGASKAYRFVVDLLLETKISDVRIPGMRCIFVYGEFGK